MTDPKIAPRVDDDGTLVCSGFDCPEYFPSPDCSRCGVDDRYVYPSGPSPCAPAFLRLAAELEKATTLHAAECIKRESVINDFRTVCRESATLRAKLAAAEKDKARLDTLQQWLTALGCIEIFWESDTGMTVIPSLVDRPDNIVDDDLRVTGDLRAAIDGAGGE